MRLLRLRYWVPAICLLALAGFSSCKPGESPPVRTVRTFVEALSGLDLDRMVSCLDPRYEQLYQGGKALAKSMEVTLGSRLGMGPFEVSAEMKTSFSALAALVPPAIDLLKEALNSYVRDHPDLRGQPMLSGFKITLVNVEGTGTGNGDATVNALLGIRAFLSYAGEAAQQTVEQACRVRFSLRKFKNGWRIVSIADMGTEQSR